MKVFFNICPLKISHSRKYDVLRFQLVQIEGKCNRDEGHGDKLVKAGAAGAGILVTIVAVVAGVVVAGRRLVVRLIQLAHQDWVFASCTEQGSTLKI